MKREFDDPDHESFRAWARSVLDREVKPTWDQYNKEATQLPRETWLGFGPHGHFGLQIPEHDGGSAAGNLRYNAVLGEELREELGEVPMLLSSGHGIHADIVTRRPGRVAGAAAPRGTSGSMNER